MIIIHIKPNTPEWLEFRRDRIGASDFAVICANKGLCKNIYNKSLLDLAMSKKHKQTEQKSQAMEYGTNKEDHIRDEASKKYNKQFDVAISVNDDYPYCMATYDGWHADLKSSTAEFLEIKCITKNRINFDGLLRYYMMQMIHQYYCENNSYSVILPTLLVNYELTNLTDTYLFNVTSGLNQFALIDAVEMKIVESINMSYEDWHNMCATFRKDYMIEEDHSFLNDNLDEIKRLEEEKKIIEEKIKVYKQELRNNYPNGIVTDKYKINMQQTSKTDYDSWSKTYFTKLKLEDKLEEITKIIEGYTYIDWCKYAKDKAIKINDEFVTKEFKCVDIRTIKEQL